jgi:hypothetical protein
MTTAGWVPMMLPSALPAIARGVREGDGVLAAPLFAGSYAGMWALVGLSSTCRSPSPSSPSP